MIAIVPPQQSFSARSVARQRVIAFVGVVALLLASGVAGQAPRTNDARGDLLYSTYCIGCHTTQMHWRDDKLATDWTSLTNQVRRWQSNAGLALTDDDIDAIARYLNRLYYHFPTTDTKQTGRIDTPTQTATPHRD